MITFRYARSVDSQHISTSAKTGIGVNEVFGILASSIYLILINLFLRDIRILEE